MDASKLSPVLSIKETALYLRASQGHVFNLLRRGELLSLKIGGRRLIRRTDLERLLEQSVPFERRTARVAAPRSRKTLTIVHSDQGIFG